MRPPANRSDRKPSQEWPTVDSVETSDRAELIERLKRGESPTWVPHRGKQEISSVQTDSVRQDFNAPLSGVGEFYGSPPSSSGSVTPFDVERVASALHSGDFAAHYDSPPSRPFGRMPWLPSSPTDGYRPFRSRSNSYIPSNAFLRAPTSPLIQSTNANLEYSPTTDPISISSRRMTLSSMSPPSLPRRQSISESPLQRAAMVGSYEESIMRGRMSSVPSRPVDFLAEIGVLGLGGCKASLRCPPHVNTVFPAVFYRDASGTDIPGPHVGLIDLENNLEPSEEPAEEGRKRNPSKEAAKRPPGGSYRVPAKGQLQVIIKNPHKTAVKLFLVPYDLKEMPVGTKTFVRQKSYSQDLGYNALRYLIHLNFCHPATGRYYLYKSIRVVFVNHCFFDKCVRTEISFPDPKFTPYKPTRDAVTIDKTLRRRSTGISFGQPFPQYSRRDSLDSVFPSDFVGGLGLSFSKNRRMSLMRVNPAPDIRESENERSTSPEDVHMGESQSPDQFSALSPPPQFLQYDRVRPFAYSKSIVPSTFRKPESLTEATFDPLSKTFSNSSGSQSSDLPRTLSSQSLLTLSLRELAEKKADAE
jgi:hypothetical protein